MSFEQPKFENPPIPPTEKSGEMSKAEQAMTPERLVSELREKVLAENFEAPEPITEQRKQELKEEIDNVADIFGKAQRPWFLGGGVGLELHNGEFQRNHWDQDVSIYEEDRKAFIEAVRKSGYDFFVASHAKEDAIATDKQITGQHNFHLNKTDERAPGPKFIDLWILDREKDTGNVVWDGKILPKNLFENSPRYTSDNGREVSLVPKEALILHKILGGRQLDFQDLKMSLSGITAEERQRVDAYLKKFGIVLAVGDKETQNLEELMRLAEATTKDAKENFIVPEIEKAVSSKFRQYNADKLKTLEQQLKRKAWDMPRWEIKETE